jgi:hypothetical protein
MNMKSKFGKTHTRNFLVGLLAFLGLGAIAGAAILANWSFRRFLVPGIILF